MQLFSTMTFKQSKRKIVKFHLQKFQTVWHSLSKLTKTKREAWYKIQEMLAKKMYLTSR